MGTKASDGDASERTYVFDEVDTTEALGMAIPYRTLDRG